MLLFLSQEQRSLKAGDLSHQESNNMAASTMKLQSDSFSTEKVNWLQRNKKKYRSLRTKFMEHRPIFAPLKEEVPTRERCSR